MTSEEQDKLVLSIRNTIVRTAETLNLTATFAPVRRKSDVLFVKLRGKHQYACAMASCLVDLLPEVDIEIPKSLQLDDYFTLIITQKLADQEVIIKERRAKLRNTIGVELKAPIQPVTPQDLYNTLFPENM